MNVPPHSAELPIQLSPSNAKSQQSNSIRPTQSETTTDVGRTGVGQSLQVEKDACVATDDLGIDNTQFHSDVLSTQGNSGARPRQQRQDALAPNQVRGPYYGRTSTVAAQSQPTVSQSSQPLVHPMENPEEMHLRERIEFARNAVLLLAEVNPLLQAHRNGELIHGVVNIIRKQSLESCERSEQNLQGDQSSLQFQVSAAQRALEMIDAAYPNLDELSGIEELRALERVALGLANLDPKSQKYMLDGTLAKGLEHLLGKKERAEAGGAIEIEEMRKLLRSFNEWEEILKLQTSPECRKAQEELAEFRKALCHSEPVQRALEMFKYAHNLAASCERRSPLNFVLPVGLTFVEDDMDALAGLRKDLFRVLKFNKKKIDGIKRVVNSVKSDQQYLNSVSKVTAQPINLMDMHRTFKDGSHFAELTFDSRLARTSRFLTPVVFWGEFIRSVSSEGWGDRQEDARHSLGASRAFQVTVLAGGHSESGLDEPESWWDWSMRMAAATGFPSR